jgi:hypothetical protein
MSVKVWGREMRTESVRRRTVNDGSLSALGLADEEIHQVASDKNVEIDGDLHNMRAWSVRSTEGGSSIKARRLPRQEEGCPKEPGIKETASTNWLLVLLTYIIHCSPSDP